MPFLLKNLKRGLLPLLLLAVLFPTFAMAQTCTATIAPTTDHLVDNNDGSVSDPKTGLIWKKCSEGQTYNSGNNSCDNNANVYDWGSALQQAQNVNESSTGENLGETDWRVPNSNELQSIVELSCYIPAINKAIFSGAPPSFFWSSSSDADYSHFASVVHFHYGYVGASNKDNYYHVRLVRSGQ